MWSMLDLLKVSSCISCTPQILISQDVLVPMACSWLPQELSGRDADVNVVSNEQMQLTMAAAGPVDIHHTNSSKAHMEADNMTVGNGNMNQASIVSINIVGRLRLRRSV